MVDGAKNIYSGNLILHSETKISFLYKRELLSFSHGDIAKVNRISNNTGLLGLTKGVNMFAFISKQGRVRANAARGLYATIMKASRNPAFFSTYGVPDTVEGRFEVLAMHGGVLVNRLSSPEMGREGAKLAQAFFDVMFKDLDWSLREMGVGDLGVPRRVKKMMSAFKGRAVAYDESLKAGIGEVKHALIRNMYGQAAEASSSKLDEMAAYMQLCANNLAKVSLAEFQQGLMSLPELNDSGVMQNKIINEECDDNGSKEAA